MTEGTPESEARRPPSKLEAALANVWARSVHLHLERIAAVEEAAAAMVEDALGPELRERAARQAHALAGTLGSFGLLDAGERARRIEILLRSEGPLGPREGETVTEAAASIRAAIEEGPPSRIGTGDHEGQKGAGDGGVSAPVARRVLLIVDDDEALTQALELQARARNFDTIVALTIAEGHAAIEEGGFDAAVIDLGFPQGPTAGMQLLEKLGDRSPGVPKLVFTARDTFVDRVEAARLGVQGFLDKPALPSQVLDTVEELLAVRGEADIRIIVVDDDPSVLSIMRSVLEREGVEVRGLSDPTRFWWMLEDVDPDMIILDLDMPGVEGLDLLRVIRNDARWAKLPVLVLTSHTDAETVESAFEAGADDHVAKPIRVPELMTRIRNRVSRMRRLRRSGDIDALTGVATRARSQEILQRYLKLGERHNQPVALGIVDIDRMKNINDSYGHPAGDRALRLLARTLQEAFRQEDSVSRWGGEEFAIGMYGMTREDGVQRLAAVLERMRGQPLVFPDGRTCEVTFSGGVAAFPDDGRTVDKLYRMADEALYSAKQAGRCRIFPYRRNEGEPGTGRE